MKNYLIYVRALADKQTSDDLSIYDQIYMLENFARSRRWNVIGYVADNDAQANLKNLRRYLEKRTDIDVVVTAELQHHSWVASTAMKAILDRKKIKLITISICREDDD